MSSQEEGGRADAPRAVVHKQILDGAESDPDASIEELASAVTGASPNLVERVLDEYGDPVASTDDQVATDEASVTSNGETDTTMAPQDASDPEQPEGSNSDATTEPTTTTGPSTTPQPTVDDNADESHPLEDVTEKQLALLETIQERPNATQQDLATEFDVSQATISNHLNSIEGFDWHQREAFVEAMFDDNHQGRSTDEPDEKVEELSELTERVEALTEMVAELDQRLDAIESDCTASLSGIFTDAELASKLLHACLNDENITFEEELEILQAFVAGNHDPSTSR